MRIWTNSSPICSVTSIAPRTRRTAESGWAALALLTTAVTLLAAAPSAGAQGLGDGFPVVTLVPRSASVGDVAYDGMLTTTIRNTERCGEARVDTTVSLPSRLIVGPPVSGAPLEPGFPEAVGEDKNPISVVLDQILPADAARGGAIALRTAARFAATSPPLILQYWTLKDELNETFSGRLDHDHRGEGAAANLLAAVRDFDPCRPALGGYPDQFPIAVGAALRVREKINSAELVIRGVTLDQTRLFAARFTGIVR